MAFSALTQFALDDEAGKNRWLLEHYLEHVKISQSVQTTYSVAPTEYPIQTMDDPKVWLSCHQQMSQSVWTAINGGQSIDLETLDWENPVQVLDWFNIHASWHFNVRTTLGL